MLTITSRENPQIKQVCGLLSAAKKRRKEGLFVCEGFTLLDLDLKPGCTVITGANMGGKSVALKTIALNILLIQFMLKI